MNDKLKYMPLDIVFGAMVFFYHLSNELTQTILNYLHKELLNKLTIQQKEALDQSGVGINRSMVLLKEMLPSLTRLPSLTSTNV